MGFNARWKSIKQQRLFHDFAASFHAIALCDRGTHCKINSALADDRNISLAKKRREEVRHNCV